MTKKINLSGLALAMAISMNVSAGETAQTYLTSSSGLPLLSSNSECVSSEGGMTAKQLNACGYVKEAQAKVASVHVEIVANGMNHSVTTTKNDVVVVNAALLFEFDSAELKESSKFILDERMERFHGNLEIVSDISVIGHTDSTGADEYNQQLSEKRAKAVAEYIENNAYTPDLSVKVAGRGESEPQASNDSSTGRQKNRRVEIRFNGIGS